MVGWWQGGGGGHQIGFESMTVIRGAGGARNSRILEGGIGVCHLP